ncbi:tRNA1(Val) (adenine(37)-N6)-methyltransferase [Lewinella sp. LCG006]|uniref:tRNA1(Val) (adenine(37)-N6)-methyltransferase n=1 Tax=Lewinella sp. LCG006 TaxID=3231911 RepID=UPI00345FACC3
MPRNSSSFRFQQFTIEQDKCAMKVGTDGILLGAWAPLSDSQQILDIGAGTGLIGLMLAQRKSDAEVTMVEVDEQAAEQAMSNVAASPFGDRIKVVCCAVQEFRPEGNQQFELIVSNPPFFTGGVISEQEGRASVRHTVKLSHQDLLRSVQRLLSPTGSFCLVLPWLEGLRFMELAKSYHLYTWQKIKVSGSPEKSPNRLLLLLRKTPPPGDVSEDGTLSIYATDGADAPRSDAYKELTADFFVK